MHKDANRAMVDAMHADGEDMIVFTYYGNGLKRIVRRNRFYREPRSASFRRLVRALHGAEVRPGPSYMGWTAYVGYGKGG